MTEEADNGRKDLARSLSVLAMVNAGIWALSIIALVFVIQRCPGAKGMFPILAGGGAVASVLVSSIWRQR